MLKQFYKARPNFKANPVRYWKQLKGKTPLLFCHLIKCDCCCEWTAKWFNRKTFSRKASKSGLAERALKRGSTSQTNWDNKKDNRSARNSSNLTIWLIWKFALKAFEHTNSASVPRVHGAHRDSRNEWCVAGRNNAALQFVVFAVCESKQWEDVGTNWKSTKRNKISLANK